MRNCFIFLLMILIFNFPAKAELGLALAPMRVEINIPAGSQHTDSLRLTNDADDSVRIRTELLDWYMDESMTPQFADRYAQEKNFSCRDWLEVNPREFDMPATESFRVRYTIRVPAGTPDGEYHCGAGFVTLPPVNPDQPPMGVNIAVRAVAALYIIVGNPSSDPVLKDFSLRALPDGTWQAVTRMENLGLRHFRTSGFLEIQNSDGQLVDRLEYPPIPVLPKRVQTFPIPLKTVLAPGTYILRSQVDVGLPEVLEGSARLVVEPPAHN
ncbi:MAG: hypothetical protein A3F68_07980 [Acidobacteria bacterium RIFCSPLOWO2_12_FULL_54_10]|nr:MAG: hypothetical protein A3F68_07980 [Acidobacteria bacterium RIFCSPLOWO2_12_FULL_54_10]